MKNLRLFIILLLISFPRIALAATQLLSQGFESGTSGLTISADTPSGTTACSSVCTERQTSVKRTGSYAAVICNGSVTDGYLQYNATLTEGDEIYIKYYQYFPSATWNWSGISNSGMKQGRVGATQGDGWPLMMLKAGSLDPHTDCYYSDGGPQPPGIPQRTFFKNISGWPEGTNFPATGEWHKVEMYFKWDGTSGGYWWKVDDYLIAGNESITHDVWPTSWGSDIANVRFAGGNGMPGSNGFYYIDDVEIWDGIPDEVDTTAPTISSVTIAPDGDTLTIGYPENVSATSSPTTSDDYINVDCTTTGSDITLTYSSGDGTSNHVYTLGTEVQESGTDTCDLDMTEDAAFVDDSANVLDVAITDEPITNNSTQGDAVEPEVSGNAVIGGDGYEVTINFSEIVDTTGYDNGDFVIDIDGGTQGISLNSITGAGSSRTFTSATQIQQDDVCTLEYNGDVGEITDLSGNSLAQFENDAMDNQSTQPAPIITNTTAASFECAETIEISVTTDENATVKYGADEDYDLMDGEAFGDGTMAGSGTQSHTETISIAACGASYTVYVRGEDGSSNQNDTSVEISFDVEPEETPGTGNYTYEWGDATDTDYPGTIQDTYLNVNTDNYSSSDTLNTYTYPADTSANAIILKIDVSDIPSGATIVNATLSLYFNSYVLTGGDSTYTLPAHRIINVNPNIASCNGRYYDGVNEWTDTGEVYDLGLGDIYPVENSAVVNLSYGYKTWHPVFMVQYWVDNPSENYGVLINSDDTAVSNSNRYFASSEASNSDIRPKLVITYSLKKATVSGGTIVGGAMQ